MGDLNRKKAWELLSLLEKKEISAVELTTSCLSEIDRTGKKLNSFIIILADSALDKAREIDVRRSKGQPVGKLAGIPVAVKDIFCTQGFRTTCGSKILENFVPPYDATVIRKLKEADAVIIGKTNMDEFAMGSSTEHSAFGPTLNPLNPAKVPGGSSGGSAAAVAAHQTVLALGTDTGGSVRQPASLCGIAGFRPTYGAVSRYGLVAFASSLDQISPFAKDARDLWLISDAIAGHDRKDSTSIAERLFNYPFSGFNGKVELPKNTRFGVPKEFWGEGLAPEVREAVRDAIDKVVKAGYTVEEVSLPALSAGIAVYYIICTAEASSNLARYDGVKYGLRVNDYADLFEMYAKTREAGFGAEVKRRIILGTYVLSSGYYDAYYLKAQKVRAVMKKEFTEVFKKVDFLLGPTTPSVAFEVGEKTDDPMEMYLNDIYTVPINLAGVPAVSIPCGKNKDGLPMGLQIIGPQKKDEMLLRAAMALENLGITI
jgi:aspartyl-tRNA(Asn)/glutamyl-tRNA(Gln) amidotransferase subunit A